MNTWKEPRVGLHYSVGRWMLHANWARSWDGWGNESGDVFAHKLFCVEFVRSGESKFLQLVLWRALFMIGRA